MAPDSLLALVNHFKGTQVLTPPEPALDEVAVEALDLKDIKGQETASRTLVFSSDCVQQRPATRGSRTTL